MATSPKYQVFISSTFADLEAQRNLVTKAILDLDHIPAGMESFPASSVKQMDYIRKLIDQCDYYVLIIAGKYGSVDESGTSYTELEFDYAISQGKCVLAFPHKSPEKLPLELSETDPDRREKLRLFIERTKGSLVKYWEDSNDLATKVSAALYHAFKDQPQIGWVRGNSVLKTQGDIRAEFKRALATQEAKFNKQVSNLNASLNQKDLEITELKEQLREKNLISVQTSIDNLTSVISPNSSIYSSVDVPSILNPSNITSANLSNSRRRADGAGASSAIISGINSIASKIVDIEQQTTHYQAPWQQRLFSALDKRIAAAKIYLSGRNFTHSFEDLGELIDRVVPLTLANEGLLKGRQLTVSEVIGELNGNGLGKSARDAYARFSAVRTKIDLGAAVSDAEANAASEDAFVLIERLKSMWPQVAEVVQSHVPLFSDAMGGKPWGELTRGLILQRYSQDASAQLHFVVTTSGSGQRLVKGNFVTWEFDAGKSLQRAYYKMVKSDRLEVAFNTGKIFVGSVISF